MLGEVIHNIKLNAKSMGEMQSIAIRPQYQAEAYAWFLSLCYTAPPHMLILTKLSRDHSWVVWGHPFCFVLFFLEGGEGVKLTDFFPWLQNKRVKSNLYLYIIMKIFFYRSKTWHVFLGALAGGGGIQGEETHFHLPL